MTVPISELQTVTNTKKPGLSQLQYLQRNFGKHTFFVVIATKVKK